MIHFIYLLCFSFFIAVIFAVISKGEFREKLFYGVKVFLQFVLISLALAWLLYLIPF